MEDVSIWTLYTQSSDPSWKLCLYRKLALEDHNIMTCSDKKDPVTDMFSIKVGSPGGISIREVQIFGYGKRLNLYLELAGLTALR